MGKKKVSFNPIEFIGDAVADLVNGEIFDLEESAPKTEKVTNGTDSNADDVGDGGDEYEGGDGTETVVKSGKRKSGTRTSKRTEEKGKTAGAEDSESDSDE